MEGKQFQNRTWLVILVLAVLLCVFTGVLYNLQVNNMDYYRGISTRKIANRETVEAAGMVVSGTSPDGRIVETVEIPKNTFFVAGQFHPEFKSRPNRAHPLFKGFISAAVDYRENREK